MSGACNGGAEAPPFPTVARNPGDKPNALDQLSDPRSRAWLLPRLCRLTHQSPCQRDNPPRINR